MGKLTIIKNGMLDENPTFRLVLGTCPTLALTGSATTALGMGAAATFVLIGSNMAISALRKVIPDKVRIPAFITVIAGFVTALEMLMKAFLPSLYDALGVYLPLIGLGFMAALLSMSVVRELLGAGTLFGLRIFPEKYAIGILTRAPGGFLVFGVMMALATFLMDKRGKKAPSTDCGGDCADCGGCREEART